MSLLIQPPEINRESEPYMRMTAAGFVIGKAQLLNELDHPEIYKQSISVPEELRYYQLRVPFECVCHRQEIFSRMVCAAELDHHEAFRGGKWDAALEIERFGSTGVEHLKADGFSPAEIRRIRYVYDLYDEVVQLRRDVKIARVHSTDYYMMGANNDFSARSRN